ncbi:MoaD/ThiS family protein [Chloroflexota bacterium]
MGKVQLKISPSFSNILDAQSSDWLTVEKEVGEGATIRDLLADLVSNYDGFREVAFNPDVGEVSDEFIVLLNDNLMQDSDITETKLNDGDSIMLLDVVVGG